MEHKIGRHPEMKYYQANSLKERRAFHNNNVHIWTKYNSSPEHPKQSFEAEMQRIIGNTPHRGYTNSNTHPYVTNRPTDYMAHRQNKIEESDKYYHPLLKRNASDGYESVRPSGHAGSGEHRRTERQIIPEMYFSKYPYKNRRYFRGRRYDRYNDRQHTVNEITNSKVYIWKQRVVELNRTLDILEREIYQIQRSVTTQSRKKDMDVLNIIDQKIRQQIPVKKQWQRNLDKREKRIRYRYQRLTEMKKISE